MSRQFQYSWLSDFAWLVYENSLLTCKFCKTFPSMAGNSDFLKGCKTFKKETLKIHSENQKHKVCRDAVIVEKKEGSVKDKFAQI